MNRIIKPTNPVMFDRAVGSLQDSLGANISWLDHIFGVVERLDRIIDGKRYHTANVYTGKDNYIQVEPCSELGNFCFFYLKDPQELAAKDNFLISCPISAVFWYDMSKVSSSSDERNREAIKAQILNVLNKAHLPTGHFEFNRIYEKPSSVFSEFSYEHIDNQFLMSPYAGFRIDGTVITTVPCYNN